MKAASDMRLRSKCAQMLGTFTASPFEQLWASRQVQQSRKRHARDGSSPLRMLAITRDLAAAKMTPAQIVEAKRVAAEWKPNKP